MAAIITKLKPSDPNLDKFENDKYKIIYTLIKAVAFDIAYFLTVMYLPEKVVYLVTLLLEIFY